MPVANAKSLLVEATRNGYAVRAFNQAFREFQLKCEWSVERYRDLLRIGGGRERLQQFFQ